MSQTLPEHQFKETFTDDYFKVKRENNELKLEIKSN